MTGSPRPAPGSAWGPLRQPVFRSIWLATIASFIGTWMHEVGAAWWMTSLTESPILIALVQSASTLPVFFLALPAGALADVVDRRRLLLSTQIWMMGIATGLGILAYVGVNSAWVLLGLTFALGIGTAMSVPAWQATVPEIVSKEDLPAALSLNGAGINIARAIGPALGGFIIAAVGPGAVFFLNAVSFLVVIGVLYRWRRAPRESALPAERFLGAMRTGIRYVRFAGAFRITLLRGGLFSLTASSLMALLPIVARGELGFGPLGYGSLLGCLGLGAVSSTPFLPRLRNRFKLNGLIAGATLIFAGVIVTLAHVRIAAVLFPVMVIGGFAWLALMTSFNLAAQASVAPWVRARGMAVYVLVQFGGMAGGSAIWGAAADWTGVDTSLSLAGVALAASLLPAVRFRLVESEKLDLTPAGHWPDPVVTEDVDPEGGPVLVTIVYTIDPKDAGAFNRAMRAVRAERLRTGAIFWGLYRDTADPARQIETFVVESWVEHMRQHERVTVSDQAAEARARPFQIEGKPVQVSHYVHTYPPGEER